MSQLCRRVAPAFLVGAALILGACVPSESSGLREVDDGSETARTEAAPPDLGEPGDVTPELMVEGLTHDFTTRPAGQEYWSPHSTEATCAAEQIVADIGADRLVALGYRPGVLGASLNDVELDDDERRVVVDAFSACVDMVEGLASLFYGAGRMPTRVAVCVARGMGVSGQLDPLVEAWASGGAVDPFEEDSQFASTLLGHAQVCIPDEAFNWPDVRLPDEDPIIDSDLPAGVSGSPYVDDAPTTTVADTAVEPPAS